MIERNNNVYIPVSKPVIDNGELEAVENVLKSGMFTQGKITDEFENLFSNYIDTRNSIAVSNGTIALDITLKALGINEGDDVITTPFTFIATANSILYQRARPVFADIDDNTFNIDPEDILNKITKKTKAIIGVHLFGHPFDVKTVQKICEDHNLFLIEDCAQAHGAKFGNKKVGSFGIGCFSFYPTKNMTTGEGGIITTNDSNISELCKLLRNHGQSSKYFHTILGYNYRMTDIEAAIGIVQLKKLDKFNNRRIKNAEYLNKHIKMNGIIIPYKEKNVKHVYHQYVIKIKEEIIKRDIFSKYLTDHNIGCAVHYPLPIYKQPLYQKLCYDNVKCPITEKLANEVLSIPVNPSITEENLKYIVDTINNFEV